MSEQPFDQEYYDLQLEFERQADPFGEASIADPQLADKHDQWAAHYRLIADDPGNDEYQLRQWHDQHLAMRDHLIECAAARELCTGLAQEAAKRADFLGTAVLQHKASGPPFQNVETCDDQMRLEQ